MSITRAIVFAAISSCVCATAQAAGNAAVVNKCTAADGSVVYSDKPCADNQKSQKVDTSAALRTGSGGHNDAIASTVADANCRRTALASTGDTSEASIAESNRHIADYQQRQRTLATQKAYAPDGSGNLVDDPEARKTIAELDRAIAKEREFQQKARASSSAKNDAALKACDQAAAKNAQAQQEKK